MSLLHIVNAASFVAPACVGMNALYPTGDTIFGAETAVAVSPTPSLANIQVLIEGEPAPLTFVSPRQINFLIAEQYRKLDRINVVVMGINGQLVAESVELAACNPGLFTLRQNGQGCPIGLSTADGLSYQALNSTTPVLVDSTPHLVLFGTGFDPTRPVRATLDGLPIDVRWAGAMPAFPGLDQVNLFLPPTTEAGLAELRVCCGDDWANAVDVLLG